MYIPKLRTMTSGRVGAARSDKIVKHTYIYIHIY